MKFENQSIPTDLQIRLFQALLRPRLIEEKMLSLLRQGKISKWFSGMGQEAISVGCTEALEPQDMIFTLHRNLGVFTSREVPLTRLFAQWQGKLEGFTKGRDRSFHFGSLEHHIVGMISHLGPQLSLADGVALAYRLRRQKHICLAFTGEGGTSEGEFHEALNVAAVWQLPVLFVIENNGYGLSTPVQEQYRCEHLAHRGIGYGMESHMVDGNNVLAVFSLISRLADSIRKEPRPILIEAKTFRMRGHEEASGTKYVPDSLMKAWAEKDPIKNYQDFLLDQGILDADDILNLTTQIRESIEDALKEVAAYSDVQPDQELDDVYIPHSSQTTWAAGEQREIRFIDAIQDGLTEAMERHEELVLMGQDIADYGGVFKITEGFVDRFGKDRVRNTPLCESAIIGAGIGLGLMGMKSMVEMQFADFVSCGFNQIVNNAAKLYYRWGAKTDLVIRMPTGAGTGAGPFHSQSNEAWFFHVPGLKIVYPSTPRDAKGLLLASFEDPNPILYFEHKALYRKIRGKVSDGYYTTEIGKAAIVRSGQAVTIVTYGMGVHWALDLVNKSNIDAEIIDLRTLLPWDKDTVMNSVKKTHRILVLHEDTMTGGIGAEIAAYINQYVFAWLDAPVIRTASLDTPVPFADSLETVFLGNYRLEQDLQFVLDY